MTQQVFNDIDPNVTSGTDLATLLNNFKASVLSAHSGPSEPTYKVVGTNWLDTAVADKLTMKIYDGTNWISEFTIDTIAHTISFGGNNPIASFTVSRSDNSADMLEMFRNIGVPTNAGLIFSQINDNSIKKTFAKFKMVTENVTDTEEEASFLLEALVAGSIATFMSVSKDTFKVRALEGSGDRVVKVNSNGEFFSEAQSSANNIYKNGSASSADLTTYTVNAPMQLNKSTTASELIDSTQVFKAIASADRETFETQVINLPNNFINSPMIVSLKYKTSEEWTLDILNGSNDAVIKSITLDPYTPVLNDAKLKKAFHLIPSTVSSVKIQFVSSAASTLLFDSLEIYSWAQVDEPLYFSEDILNNITNQSLFDIVTTKNKLLKVEGQIIRETDTDLADSIVSFNISNNGTVNRIGNENVFDHEDTETLTNFNINGSSIEYSTSDIAGANYVGKFYGKITRVL